MVDLNTKTPSGGEFVILGPQIPDFSPEDFSEEQILIAESTREFVKTEILSRLNEIDSQSDPKLVPHLLDLSAQLGLLGAAIPESYGGAGLDFMSNMLITEEMGRAHSFAVSFGAHTGIGTLPILYYGNDHQKQKYLPKLASGEWKAAYCLTEPDAGSDANAGKTSAKLNEAATHYILNGQKMWISNAGFADVLTVFARIENDKYLSAFVVERNFGGITMNPEEHKMGIKGSSTRQIFFNDTPVPKENLLGQRGEGFKIAVHILNIGRLKLHLFTVGSSKQVLEHVCTYANQRKQFGKKLIEFEAIQEKIGWAYIRSWASEAAGYRACKLIENTIKSLTAAGLPEVEARIEAADRFAIECALLKFHGSEVLDYVADEGVQIYGGMGYSADAPMERMYRDARINRIFEGTNEINRMLAVGTLIKKAMKGEIALMPAIDKASKSLMEFPEPWDEETPFAAEYRISENLKKAFLLLGGSCVKAFGQNLEARQSVMLALADVLAECWVAESAVMRAHRNFIKTGEMPLEELELVRCYLFKATEVLQQQGRRVLAALPPSDETVMLGVGIKRFSKTPNWDVLSMVCHLGKGAQETYFAA